MTLQQVVGPHENPSCRRLGRFREYQLLAMDQHLVSQRFLLRRVVVDPPCPGNAPSWPAQHRGGRDAREEYKVVRLQRVGDGVLMCALQPADLPHAARAAIPSLRLAQEEYMAKTCDKREAYCSTSGVL